MMEETSAKRATAEARLKKIRQNAENGAVAMAEYEASAISQRAKTARLKALRLEKEAAETAVIAEAPPVAKKRRR